MNYLLDTNIVTFLYDDTLEPQYSKLFQKIESLEPQENLYVSVLTVYEKENSVIDYAVGNYIGARELGH